jgi:acetoacetate decarboxylase
MARFVGAEILRAHYRTLPDAVSAVLPKPLEAPLDPLATVFVARYPETNFSPPYNEGALFVDARYRGEHGLYCLAMPVTDDMAMIGGREYYGYPKKIADEITLDRDGGHIVGRIVRKGTELLRIEAELTDNTNPSDVGLAVTEDLDGKTAVKAVSFLFKFFPSATTLGFEHPPRLIRQVSLLTPRGPLDTGAGKVELASTPFDPLGEIPVVELLAISHGVFDSVMLPGTVAAQVRNPLRFARYAFFKTDALAYLQQREVTPMSRRRRRRRAKAIGAY